MGGTAYRSHIQGRCNKNDEFLFPSASFQRCERGWAGGEVGSVHEAENEGDDILKKGE